MSLKLVVPLWMASLAAVALAQPQADPPARVARLNYPTGPVSFRPGSVDDWTAAVPNYPLSAGDYLWADRGAVAAIHAGSPRSAWPSRP
ncbi:MAG: hypothetical protein JO336_01725, partial [Acidobacteriia bacterium]|nr:hypothetical protein [Terriglobia bacterium]